jgi:hypothetical protein
VHLAQWKTLSVAAASKENERLLPRIKGRRKRRFTLSS